MESQSAFLRRYQPADLDDLYRICLQTSDNGRDGTALFSRPRLPGDLYVGPYALFEPSLTLVAQDGAGVGGYIVGARDSLTFEQSLERDWWPALRSRYPEPPPRLARELSVQEQNALHDIHHPWPTADGLADEYPSHLHINLLPRLQGRGIGRQLIAALISELRDQGSSGVHLLVGRANQRAAGFYRHVGFTELPGTAIRVFAMSLGDPADGPACQDGQRGNGAGVPRPP
jgi:ribosomal protein S18 acetylase RimI-like enzyme